MSMLSGVLNGVSSAMVPQFTLWGDDVIMRVGASGRRIDDVTIVYLTLVDSVTLHVYVWFVEEGVERPVDAFVFFELTEVPERLADLASREAISFTLRSVVTRGVPVRFEFSDAAKEAYSIWRDQLLEQGHIQS